MTASNVLWQWQPQPSVADRLAEGRELRARVPRRSLAELTIGERDPIGLLNRQNEARVQALVPLRTERMSASAFTFYRGSAALMADDLARGATTGIGVASCGDAHVSNFGFYASQSRQLVFDLNDFDEAGWAPWEWDLKRLVASIVIAGQATGRDDRVVQQTARDAVLTYAQVIDTGARLSPLRRYYARFNIDDARGNMSKHSREVLRQAIRTAMKRTGDRAVARVTELDPEGRLRFIEDAPTMTHVSQKFVEGVPVLVQRYLESASADIRMVMRNYVVSDVVRRVVGVGSVGTRCFLTVFQDGHDGALLLQSKEAGRSVLEQYGGILQPPVLTNLVEAQGEGARVVAMQRILQAESDPFLGCFRSDDGLSHYQRQWHDMKGGIEMDTLDDGPFKTYAEACAAVLARAQSANAPVVAGYLGRGRAAAEALTEWSYAYADLSRSDYRTFLAAHT